MEAINGGIIRDAILSSPILGEGIVMKLMCLREWNEMAELIPDELESLGIGPGDINSAERINFGENLRCSPPFKGDKIITRFYSGNEGAIFCIEILDEIQVYGNNGQSAKEFMVKVSALDTKGRKSEMVCKTIDFHTFYRGGDQEFEYRDQLPLNSTEVLLIPHQIDSEMNQNPEEAIAELIEKKVKKMNEIREVIIPEIREKTRKIVGKRDVRGERFFEKEKRVAVLIEQIRRIRERISAILQYINENGEGSLQGTFSIAKRRIYRQKMDECWKKIEKLQGEIWKNNLPKLEKAYGRSGKTSFYRICRRAAYYIHKYNDLGMEVARLSGDEGRSPELLDVRETLETIAGGLSQFYTYDIRILYEKLETIDFPQSILPRTPAHRA